MAENRQHPRKFVNTEVSFQIGDAGRVVAQSRDLSLGGIFIETPHPPPYGTKLRVYMMLPGLKTETCVDCTVRWVKPTGMGVQFGVMGARETHAITELLAAH